MLLNRFLIQAETDSEWSPTSFKDGDIEALNRIWDNTKARLNIGKIPQSVDRKTNYGISNTFATNVPGLYFIEVRTFVYDLIISRKLEFLPISE